MKTRSIINFNKILVLLLMVLTLGSCKYKDVVDDLYPAQKIYLPAAVYGIFNIDAITGVYDSIPVPGGNYRYLVDTLNNKFIVPLSVYRSGADNSGSFSVDIFQDNDTISQLKDKGQLPSNTLTLTPDYYKMPRRITVNAGDDIAPFYLEVDLDSLLNNLDKNFAIGVSISSDAREVSANLGTAVIYIASEIFKPGAAFSYAIDKGNSFQANFINESSNGFEYIWDFGDGSEVSHEKNPSHIYKGYGNHKVTLTVISIAGDRITSVKKDTISI